MKKDYVVISVSDEDFEDVSEEIANVVERYGLVDEVMKSWVEYLRERIDGIDADLFYDTLESAARFVMKREGHYEEYKATVGEQCE